MSFLCFFYFTEHHSNSPVLCWGTWLQHHNDSFNSWSAFLQVYYRRKHGLHETEEETDEEMQVLTFSGNRSEGRLPGLQPYSVYSLSIRVLNNKGEGPSSQSKTFETPEGGVYVFQSKEENKNLVL